MTTTIQVNVTVTAAGDSSDNGVNWAFAPAWGTPEGAVKSDGTIDLNFVPTPAGDPAVDVKFSLVNTTITWGDGHHLGTFPIRFVVRNEGALDAVLFGDGDQSKQVYSGTEFTDEGATSNNTVVTIGDKDDDRDEHRSYGLRVFVPTGTGTGITFTKDPPFKNKTNPT